MPRRSVLSSKTDYNIAGQANPWDASSNQAHYQNRATGQPFFAVFNFTTSHESQVAPKPDKTSFRAPRRASTFSSSADAWTSVTTPDLFVGSDLNGR